jgi:DNA repair exonuclease SbcCD ATPase subunit
MDHMKLSDELRKQLLESAAWGKAGIVLSEGIVEEELSDAERVAARAAQSERTKKSLESGGLTAAGAADMRKRTGAGEFDPGRKTKGSAKMKGIKEEAVHVCPLCISQLDEAIDEESLLEHLNVVVGLVDRLSQLQEGDEDIETVIDETIQELLFPASEDE